MKTLILLRHAKSSWDDDSLSDHQRPLAPRGRRAAPAVAARLVELGIRPDLVRSSTSQRTRQTLDLMMDQLGDPVVRFDESLYLAGPSGMLRSIRTTDQTVASLMLVGHNPGMHEVAVALTDRESSTAAARLDAKFPTAAAAIVEFDVDRWADVALGIGRLAHFIRPKDLKNAARDRL